jgi:hypothetical protein
MNPRKLIGNEDSARHLWANQSAALRIIYRSLINYATKQFFQDKARNWKTQKEHCYEWTKWIIEMESKC